MKAAVLPIALTLSAASESSVGNSSTSEAAIGCPGVAVRR